MNVIKINGPHFIQTKGYAMDTITVPSYTTIYMDKSENTNFYTEIKNDYFFYARYIDVIFIITTGDETKLINFQTNLNIGHGALKFYHKKSILTSGFLDTRECIDKIDNYQRHYT